MYKTSNWLHHRASFSLKVKIRLHRAAFARWQDFILGHLGAALSPEACVNLFRRGSRPYLRPWFGQRERIAMLIDHYSTLENRIDPGCLKLILTEAGHPLADMIGRSGRHYRVTIGHGTTKEGELSLCFTDAELGGVLAVMKALFARDAQGRLVLWIGGLQGSKPPLGKSDIVHATRDLNGLRPKQIVLEATRAIGQWFGAVEIIAPSIENHISRRGFRRWRRKRKIHADYDGFWEECGGIRRPDGDYMLSINPPTRVVDDVKPKKRKEWRLRQDRLDGLRGAIDAILTGLARV